MAKAKDLREKTHEELNVLLDECQRDLFHLRNKRMEEKKLEKPHQIYVKRKEIARILTVQKEKELAL